MRNRKVTAISKVFIEQEVYYEVGQNGVVEIRYHVPQGDGVRTIATSILVIRFTTVFFDLILYDLKIKFDFLRKKWYNIYRK